MAECLEELKYFKKFFFSWICVLFSFIPFGMTSDFWTFSLLQVLPRGWVSLCIPNSCPCGHSNPSSESQLARSSTCASQKFKCWSVISNFMEKGQVMDKTEQISFWFSWRSLEFNIFGASALLLKLICGFTGYWKRMSGSWASTKYDHTSPVSLAKHHHE